MGDAAFDQKRAANPDTAAAPAAASATHQALEARAARGPRPRARRVSGGPEPFQPAPQRNQTGLPDRLKAGVEALSGLSMNDVKVHYGSARPARLQAHAFTQGADIHLGPRQERHLPHEAWHVVQQKQGRVAPTIQMKGLALNHDVGLEREADAMGALAVSKRPVSPFGPVPLTDAASSGTIQLALAKEVAGNAVSLWNLFTETTAGMTGKMRDFLVRADKSPDEGPRQKTMMQEAEGLFLKTEAISSQAIGHYKEIDLISRITEQGSLVTLGSDTTKHPDLSVSGGLGRIAAVEVKAVSSANDQHVITVANKARTQLGKRVKDQKKDKYNLWQAQIFIVNRTNPWPWTALEASKIVNPKSADVAEKAEEKYVKQNPLPDKWSLSFDSLRWGTTVTFPKGAESI